MKKIITFMLVILMIGMVSAVTYQTGANMTHYYPFEDYELYDYVGITNGVFNGTVVNESDCLSGDCFSFDTLNGNTGFISFADELIDFSNPLEFSMRCGVKFNELTSEQWFFYQNKSGGVSAQRGFTFGLYGDNYAFKYLPDFEANRFNSTSSVNVGEWHVVTFSSESGNYRIYVDGVDVSEMTSYLNPIGWSNSDRNLFGYLFNGSLDECAFFDNRLNSFDISRDYLQTVLGNELNYSTSDFQTYTLTSDLVDFTTFRGRWNGNVDGNKSMVFSLNPDMSDPVQVTEFTENFKNIWLEPEDLSYVPYQFEDKNVYFKVYTTDDYGWNYGSNVSVQYIPYAMLYETEDDDDINNVPESYKIQPILINSTDFKINYTGLLYANQTLVVSFNSDVSDPFYNNTITYDDLYGYTGYGYRFREEDDTVIADIYNFTDPSYVGQTIYYKLFLDRFELFESAIGNFTMEACSESWQPFYTSCTIGDNQTLYYLDANECGTYDNLPIDNSTISSCNYCTSTYEETSLDCVAGQSQRDITYGYTNSCCDDTGLPSDCNKPEDSTESCIGVHSTNQITGLVIDFGVEFGITMISLVGVIVVIGLGVWAVRRFR